MGSVRNLFIFSVIIIFVITSVVCRRVKVAIYYESLCPYSINFVTKKFYPHYKDLKEYIQIDWIPYGKANHSRVKGEWIFQCQHGRDECKSNKLQACALDQGRGQDKNVEFINCVLSISYPGHTKGIEYCANSNTFSWEGILRCLNNGRGDDVLAKMGEKTKSLRPKLKQVPTVVYNENFDRLLNDFAIENFVKATCSLIMDPKPKIC